MKSLFVSKAIRNLSLASLLGAATFATTANSEEYHDLFSTPMGLSMGGAISSYVDDWNSLYYNPAGLANMETWSMRLPEIIHAELSLGVLDLLDAIGDLDTGGSSSIASQLSSFDGSVGSTRINPLNMGVFFNRMAFALNVADVKTSLRLQVPTLVFARAYYDSRIDTGLSAGYGHSFLGGKLRAGVAIRVLGRVGSEGFLEGTEIQDASENLLDRAGAGVGLDADLGAQGELDEMSFGRIKVKPMAGLVFKNILATKYDLYRINEEEFPGTPPQNKRHINVGASAKVSGLGALEIIPSVEFRHLLMETNSFWEYLSAGLQLGLKTGSWFNGFVRTAYYKGTFAAGIGGNLGPGELELGTYAPSIGEGFGVGVDRRFYARLALNW